MSYQTWHVYGYGICINDIKNNIEVSRVVDLVKLEPELYAATIKNNLPKDLQEIYSIFEDCADGYYGLASILQQVIYEKEGIEFCDCCDYNDVEYLVYEPRYPWSLGKKDLEITKEKIKKVIMKYLKIVTDEEILVDYQSVENGG